jgi:putative DNA primase/helicase
MLDDALRYASIGWYVFPCHWPLFKPGWSCSCEAWRRRTQSGYECDSPGKHPRTHNGLDDATIDEVQIRAWWEKWPQANIGINCGKSGLLVIDLDQYKDIYQGHDLELDEETVTALTGGGGTHLFYQMNPDDMLGNSKKGLPPGIDVRGHGGYVVVAPSLHISGNRYQWEVGYEPWS